MNTRTQISTTDDGTPRGLPAGQSSMIEQMNNPSALPNIKEARNTGEIKAGTAFLRGNMSGIE